MNIELYNGQCKMKNGLVLDAWKNIVRLEFDINFVEPCSAEWGVDSVDYYMASGSVMVINNTNSVSVSCVIV